MPIADAEDMIGRNAPPPPGARPVKLSRSFEPLLRRVFGRANGDFDIQDSESSSVRSALERMRDELAQGKTLTKEDIARIQKSANGGKTFTSAKQQEEFLAGAYQIAETEPGLDLMEVEALLGKAGRERVRQEGGIGSILTKRRGELSEEEKAEARDLGIPVTSNALAVREGIALAKRRLRDDNTGLARGILSAHKDAKAANIETLDDLRHAGLHVGETAIRSLREAGITLADLRAGRVREDQLARLEGWGEGKVRALAKLFPLVPGATLKRSPGRPPRALFGKMADPFAGKQEGRLLGNSTTLVRSSNGSLEARVVKSKFAQFRERFATAWRETIGRPFAYASQLSNTEEHKIIREAEKVANVKRAQRYLIRVQQARTTLGVNFWSALFRGQRAVMTLAALALGSAVLFVPWGVLQLAAWVVTGIVVFLLNSGYLIGLTLLNMATTSFVNVINTLGFATQNALQSFSWALLEHLPSTSTNELPPYVPTAPSFQILQMLDPNNLFPDCINTNTIGAIALAGLSHALTDFGGFIAAHGQLSVGVAILVFLALPAYIMSKGTSAGFAILAVLVMIFPFEGTEVPAWTLAGLALAVLVIVVWLWGGRNVGPIAAAVALSLGVVGLVGFMILHDALGDFDFGLLRTIRLGITPIAELLGSFVQHLGEATAWLGQQLTTGWAHALNPENLVGLRSAFNFNDPVETATAVQRCGGTP